MRKGKRKLPYYCNYAYARILIFLSPSYSLHYKDIQKKLGINQTVIHRHLVSLIKDGLVRKERRGEFILTPKGNGIRMLCSNYESLNSLYQERVIKIDKFYNSIMGDRK